MGASIVAKLGLDQGEFRAGLRQATAEAKREGQKLKEAGAGEGILESENKAERNIVGLTQEMLKADSAADLLVSSLGRIPDIFNTSLLAGVAGGVGAFLVKAGLDAKDAFEQARIASDGLHDSLQRTIRFGGAGELDTAFASIPTQIQKLNAELEKTGTLKDIVFGSVGALFGGPSLMEKQTAIIQEWTELLQQQSAIASVRIAKEEDLVAVMQLRAQGLEKEADALERQLKLAEALNAIGKVYTGETGERLKALRIEQFVLGEQARTVKEIKEAQDVAFKKAQESARKAKELEEKSGKEAEDLAKKRAREKDDRVKAEKELAEVGESGQDKQTRLLKEYAAIEEQLRAAPVSEADRLRTELAKKQIDIANNGIELNKEALELDEKRKKAVEDQLKLEEKKNQEAAKIQQKKKEKLQLSLDEIAEDGKGTDAMKARQVQRIEKRAHRAKLRGDMQGAGFHQSEADRIKSGINSLKDSEKGLTDDFKSALNDSQVLKNIEKNTQNIGKML